MRPRVRALVCSSAVWAWPCCVQLCGGDERPSAVVFRCVLSARDENFVSNAASPCVRALHSRGHCARARRPGLGLSIVRTIAEAHGGTAGAPTHRLGGSTLGSRSRRPPPTAPLLRPAAWRSPYRHDVKTGSRPPGSLRRGVDADDVQPLLADVLEHVRRVRDHHRHVAGQASLPAALAHGRGHHRIGQLARADPESASDSGTSLVARGRPSAT
jgi:hypothetical protein